MLNLNGLNFTCTHLLGLEKIYIICSSTDWILKCIENHSWQSELKHAHKHAPLWMVRICWATTESTSKSIRLNSSKQAQAPADNKPWKRPSIFTMTYGKCSLNTPVLPDNWQRMSRTTLKRRFFAILSPLIKMQLWFPDSTEAIQQKHCNLC